MSPPCQPSSSQLRRPSYFQGPDGKSAMASIQSRLTKKGEAVSQPVMEALLAQKQQGKLSNSALEHWVSKFEDEYEVYYKDSSEEKQEDLTDIEAQFEALHKEVEDEYATKKFNSSVPQHTLLDSSLAKGKVKLSHKKSFSSKNIDAKALRIQSDQINFSQKEEEIYPVGKNPFDEEDSPFGSPRVGLRVLSSNIARDIKHPKHPKPAKHIADPFILGKEPSVTVSKPLKNTSEKIQKHPAAFFPIAHLTKDERISLIEKQKNLNNIESNYQSSEQNNYEDVKVFKKRTKKKKKIISEIVVVKAEVNEAKDTNRDSVSNKEEKQKDLKAPPVTTDTLVQKRTVTEPKTQLKKDLKELFIAEKDIKQNDVVFDKEEPKQRVKGPKKPFESFQNCLFTTFTACVPWCMMKQVYWKKDRKSEELFTVTARRNSRSRIKMKFRDHRENE